MYEIIGFKPYSSEFDGKIYEGVNCHCVDLDFSGSRNAIGRGTKTFSFKKTVFDSFSLGRDYSDLLGLNINVYFDSYKKPSLIIEI